MFFTPRVNSFGRQLVGYCRLLLDSEIQKKNKITNLKTYMIRTVQVLVNLSEIFVMSKYDGAVQLRLRNQPPI